MGLLDEEGGGGAGRKADWIIVFLFQTYVIQRIQFRHMGGTQGTRAGMLSECQPLILGHGAAEIQAQKGSNELTYSDMGTQYGNFRGNPLLSRHKTTLKRHLNG